MKPLRKGREVHQLITAIWGVEKFRCPPLTTEHRLLVNAGQGWEFWLQCDTSLAVRSGSFSLFVPHVVCTTQWGWLITTEQW